MKFRFAILMPGAGSDTPDSGPVMAGSGASATGGPPVASSVHGVFLRKAEEPRTGTASKSERL